MENNKNRLPIQFRTIAKHGFVIGLFLTILLIFFAPGILEHKVLQQGDMQKFSGMVRELELYQNEGGSSAWTGAMFSGMPSYHIAVYNTPTNYLTYIESAFKALDYAAASMVLISLLCFYLLMCVMGVNRWLAIAGSIAFAFASYNIIIIVAGHITKAYVMAYMPLTLAGMYLLFKKKNIRWGVLLFALGVALSIMNGHLQITYYLALFCLFLYAGFAQKMVQAKLYKRLGQTTGLLTIGVVLAVLANIGTLYSNYEGGQTSLRGPSELTPATTGSQAKASTGLDKDYAFMWSYGKAELLTLMIPNAYGGASGGTLDADSELVKALKKNGAKVGNEVQSYTYWGDQPFTSGPVYMGALVCFLFVLGLFFVSSSMKWWAAGGALFLTCLALGRNFDLFNDFMFHYLPMYNKFRTPSMALVIPGMVLPIIGIWGVRELFMGKVSDQLFKQGMSWAVGITGGISLVVWLMPTLLLNFHSPMDAQAQMPDWYMQALVLDRATLAADDALRSLLFILAGASLLAWYFISKEKVKVSMYVGITLAVLMIADLWPVDRRYLNEQNYSNQTLSQAYKATPADIEILKDKDPSYRVLNLQNTFQDTNTSYFHKSIGGYHAAKLRRYQELIDHRLTAEITQISAALQQAKTAEEVMGAFAKVPTLNMLNMRYLIYNPGQAPIRNPYAYGNAWFVQQVEVVATADEEIAALNRINPYTTAVVDARFADQVKGFKPQADSTATITMRSYKPNQVVYSSKTASEQLAVFSEIYYEQGWKAFIDGKPAPHFRADWTLRAMLIPAGEHQIEFVFEPDTFNSANQITSITTLLILLLVIATAGYSIWGSVKQAKEE